MVSPFWDMGPEDGPCVSGCLGQLPHQQAALAGAWGGAWTPVDRRRPVATAGEARCPSHLRFGLPPKVAIVPRETSGLQLLKGTSSRT